MMKLEKLQHYKEMILYNRLFLCFKDHYQLIPGDLSKQKGWDADPRATQKFYGMLKTDSQICLILQKSKETIFWLQGNSKSFAVLTYKWLSAIK